MTDMLSRPPRRIDVGEVMNRTFGAIGANFVTFIALAFLLAALPSGLISVGIYASIPAMSASEMADDPSFLLMYSVAIMFAAFLAVIPAYILMGAITHGAIMHFNGQKASFGDCFSSGLRLSLPLVGLAIVSGIGYFLWFLLFVIPVFLAMVRWAVLVPVLAVERKGIFFEVFNRSGDLTRDNRWRVFLLGLLYFAISSLISFAISFVALILVGTAGISTVGDNPFGPAFGTASFWAQNAIQVVFGALNAMILAAGTAALYYELRRVKEGTTSDELAKVFE